MPATAPPQRQILTPSALNRLVRDLLEDALPSVWVEGELSNVARPASGHLYFTLKDARAQIRCAMFRPKSTWLKFRPAEGMQVMVRARVGLYEPRGDYQLIVEHMEEAGEGALRREFERLKAQLQNEGLFDAAHKRELPALPRRIGVITSASGAAVRDVLSVLQRRLPMVQVDVLPVPVQGREAPPAIVEMIKRAGRSGRYDVLLLTRGGGSLEDLWAFNDEAVARAIHACPVPLVSAVGHEIDTSISDFVADLRAPTPSAAAELLVPDGAALQRRLDDQQRRLGQQMERRVHTWQQRLDHLRARLQTLRPQARLQQGGERLQVLHGRLQRAALHALSTREGFLREAGRSLRTQSPAQQLPARRRDLLQLEQRLGRVMLETLQRRRTSLASNVRALQAVSPLATLDRGYAILLDADGKVVRSAATVGAGDILSARLADGTLTLQRR